MGRKKADANPTQNTTDTETPNLPIMSDLDAEITRRLKAASDAARNALRARERELRDLVYGSLLRSAALAGDPINNLDAIMDQDPDEPMIRVLTKDGTRYEITVKTRQRNR